MEMLSCLVTFIHSVCKANSKPSYEIKLCVCVCVKPNKCTSFEACVPMVLFNKGQAL